MSKPNPQRVAELRGLIDSFLAKRLDAKLKTEKLEPDDPKRESRVNEYRRENWLPQAVKRVREIQLVTHVVKATHPDIKLTQATNLYVVPSDQVELPVVGSHVLRNGYRDDVTGNSAALGAFDFLSQEYRGATLLSLMKDGDADLAQAMTSNVSLSENWMTEFARIDASRCAKPASHTLAKQLYWPTGEDVHDDASYQLLSPLYASSLAHRVFETLKEDAFFNEEAKAARKAMADKSFSERPVRRYPSLVVQQLGGTKPQNVSQLNSERRGNNSLLASLPPVWRLQDVKPLHNTSSMFFAYGSRPGVRGALKALLAFLRTDPNPNLETRNKRAAWVDVLIDEFLQYTAELHDLAPGWSQDNACQLSDAECRWLDPEGVAARDTELGRAPPTDTDERICAAFANWLNTQLRGALPMGDPEFLAWRKAMAEHIKAAEREGTYAD